MKGASFVALAAACLLAACDFDLPDPPPRIATAAPVPYARSNIAMPIAVDLTEVRDRMLAELKAKPLVDGRTPEIGIRLLAQEKSIFEEPRKVIDVPFRAAACQIEKIPKQVTEYVKTGTKLVSCLVKPWKWGQCAEDVFENVTKTIWEDVTRCVPEQAEVARTVYTAVERITPKTFETTAVIHYRVDVKSVGLDVQGQQIKAAVGVNVPVSADIKQNLLVGNITAKGALACASDLSASAEASFSLVQQDGDIGLAADVSSVDLDVKKFCVPGAVELAQAWSFTGAEQLAISQVLKLAVRKALLEALKSVVAKQASQLAFGSDVSRAVGQLRGTHPLGNDVFLAAAPLHVRMSQVEGAIVGGRQVLKSSASIDVDLEVRYGPGAPLPGVDKVPVSLGTAATSFHLRPRGVVPFDRMSGALLHEARRVATEPLKNAGFELGDVEVYQSGELIVFGVQIKGTTWWRPSGRLYLAGRPQYLPATGEIALRDFDFTADTANWLVERSLAAVRPMATSVIAPKMVFPVDARLAKATKQFEKFSVPIMSPTVAGTLAGTTVPPRLRQIWVDGNALQFDLEINGNAQLDIVLL